jgi:hypothetical protein
MNKVVLLALVGSLAFLIESCSFFSDFAKARKELDEEVAKPTPVQVDTAQNNSQLTEEELFADLSEEEEPTQAIVGLIPATNPDVRVRGSVRGRNDPFSVVSLNPRIELAKKEEEKQVSSSPDNQVNPNRVDQISPTQVQADRDLADLSVPPPPEPTLAKNVIVSGLFEANGRTRIIVQAPEESSSRYVEQGQYLSNGQVLVKRIDKDSFPSPMVILEQSGVEVAKTIGENSTGGNEISALPAKTLKNKSWVSSIPFSN